MNDARTLALGAAEDAPPVGQQLAGKYITFKLAGETYGLQIVQVREIIRLMEITRVPRASDLVRGVINLRGKVIPVVDLRLAFGQARAEATEQTVIIVVQCAVHGRDLTMGLLVDEVLEVLSIDAAHIEGPPSLANLAVEESFILGVGKTEDRIIFLLDIGRVLSDAEASEVSSAIAA